MEHLLLCGLGTSCMVGAHLNGPGWSWAPHAAAGAVMLAAVAVPGEVVTHVAVLLLLGLAAWLASPAKGHQVDGALDTVAMAALLAGHHLIASHPAGQVVGHAHASALPLGAVGLAVLAVALWCAARMLGRQAGALPAPASAAVLGTGRQTVVALGGIVMLGAMLPVAP